MTATIVHAGDESHILYIARVSSNQENTDPGLLSYLIRQNHWSPFEMVGACMEIDTTRDIGRQILRHRSFSFQEFSQRYAPVEMVMPHRDMRVAGTNNRQGSTTARNVEQEARLELGVEAAYRLYQEAIKAGVASECARAILPEGYAPTRMYMNGTLRSWIHYLRERCKLGKDGNPLAQREHYVLARDIEDVLRDFFPVSFKALDDIGYIDRPVGGL